MNTHRRSAIHRSPRGRQWVGRSPAWGFRQSGVAVVPVLVAAAFIAAWAALIGYGVLRQPGGPPKGQAPRVEEVPPPLGASPAPVPVASPSARIARPRPAVTPSPSPVAKTPVVVQEAAPSKEARTVLHGEIVAFRAPVSSKRHGVLTIRAAGFDADPFGGEDVAVRVPLSVFERVRGRMKALPTGRLVTVAVLYETDRPLRTVEARAITTTGPKFDPLDDEEASSGDEDAGPGGPAAAPSGGS